VSEALSLRRYYLLARIGSAQYEDDAISGVWQWKQEGAPPGIMLPDDFPSIDKLRPVGYVASEDLIGADEVELANSAGLSSRASQEVFAALAALLL